MLQGLKYGHRRQPFGNWNGVNYRHIPAARALSFLLTMEFHAWAATMWTDTRQARYGREIKTALFCDIGAYMCCVSHSNGALWWSQSILPSLVYPLRGLFVWTREQRCFFQLQIIIHASVSSFRFIWIPMLLVHGHYTYFYSDSAGIDFSRQNVTYVSDVSFWRLKTVPALKRLIPNKRWVKSHLYSSSG